jgi:enoyl-[acyl-carrier protein] reductase II
MSNRICQLFQIKYPIIQGGMIWCSGWKLASAVSNAGGLGLIGAGSMYPDVLREHIRKAKKGTDKPFGVNVPLIYPQTEEIINIIIEEGVKIVFTSAGNPKTWTTHLQENGIKVAHVTANGTFAEKAANAGVDAIVAEGFEAGGHNGREETTTMSLIPIVREKIRLPLIAAGGIGSGKTMLASMILGADGVQIGSRFAATHESSAHDNFKKEIIATKEGQTKLLLKKLVPVRLIMNEFAQSVLQAENDGTNTDGISDLLGRGRAKKGMFEGDLIQGELEIGQISAQINEIISAEDVIKDIIDEYQALLKEINESGFMF